MKLIDPKHSFYRPLGVRVAIVAVLVVWFGLELMIGASFWLVIVGALAVYCAWVLLIRFPAQEPSEPPPVEKEDDGSNAA